MLTDTLTRIEDGEIVIEPVLAKRLVERPRGERKDVVAVAVGARDGRAASDGRGPIEQRASPGSCSSRPRPSRSTSRTSSASSDLHADAAEHHRRVLAVLTYLRSQRDGE